MTNLFECNTQYFVQKRQQKAWCTLYLNKYSTIVGLCRQPVYLITFSYLYLFVINNTYLYLITCILITIRTQTNLKGWLIPKNLAKTVKI